MNLEVTMSNKLKLVNNNNNRQAVKKAQKNPVTPIKREESRGSDLFDVFGFTIDILRTTLNTFNNI